MSDMFQCRFNFSLYVKSVARVSSVLSFFRSCTCVFSWYYFSIVLAHSFFCFFCLSRYDDPNSAQSSFSILLGDAPHLDGKV